MATYECSMCGMAVNASCARCNKLLVNAVRTYADGSSVQVSKCPTCNGKIKSPQCCGADMNTDS